MKVKIDRMQFFLLFPNLVFAKAIGITAGIFSRRIGGDTWSSMTIGLIAGLPFMMIMVYVSSKFPEKSITQYSQELLGKAVGRLIGIILFIYFGIGYAISANVLLLHLKEYFLPETPFVALCIVYTLICAYGVMLGIEVSLRFSFLGFFMLLAITFTMITGTMNDFRLINLQPFFDKGIVDNIRYSVYIFTDIGIPILSVGFIYPLINIKRKIKTITLLSCLLASILVVVWPFFETGVMGADVMKQFVIVCMQQIRNAQLTIYLPRYELLMVSFFVWTVFVQSSVMFWCSLYSFKQATNYKKDKITMSFFIIAFILMTNRLGNDHIDYVEFLVSPWMQISLGLSVGLPLILLIAYMVRNKLSKKSSSKQCANT